MFNLSAAAFKVPDDLYNDMNQNRKLALFIRDCIKQIEPEISNVPLLKDMGWSFEIPTHISKKLTNHSICIIKRAIENTIYVSYDDEKKVL